MRNHEKALLFYDDINYLIPYMDDDIQAKMKFAKYFLNSLPIKDFENSKISIGPIDKKTFLFLIFTIVLEYDSMYRKPYLDS
jgi:hypothetical protein